VSPFSPFMFPRSNLPRKWKEEVVQTIRGVLALAIEGRRVSVRRTCDRKLTWWMISKPSFVLNTFELPGLLPIPALLQRMSCVRDY